MSAIEQYFSVISLLSDKLCHVADPNGEQWRKQSCSVEIHYKYEKGKKLLTKVYFFRDVKVSM